MSKVFIYAANKTLYYRILFLIKFSDFIVDISKTIWADI